MLNLNKLKNQSWSWICKVNVFTSGSIQEEPKVGKQEAYGSAGDTTDKDDKAHNDDQKSPWEDVRTRLLV